MLHVNQNEYTKIHERQTKLCTQVQVQIFSDFCKDPVFIQEINKVGQKGPLTKDWGFFYFQKSQQY